MVTKSKTQKLSGLIYGAIKNLDRHIEFGIEPSLSMVSLGDGFYRIRINFICRFKQLAQEDKLKV